MLDLTRSVPPTTDMMTTALREALQALAERPGLVEIGLDAHRRGGTERDRAAAAAWLAPRLGSVPTGDRLLLTHGTQSALTLLFGALLQRPGVLLTEELSYPRITALARLFGIEPVGVAMDGDGLRPDALDAACAQYRAAALYCVPTMHNPTCTMMPLSRRQAIVEVAGRHGLIIIEDDAQGLLLAEPAPPPLAVLAPERTWYVMPLSKCLGVGLRIAYLLAPRAVDVEDLLARFGLMSLWFPAPLSAALATEWVETGAGAKILTAIRQEMRARYILMRPDLRDFGCLSQPHALHVWVPAPAAMTGACLARLCGEHGLATRPSEGFVVGTGDTALRGLRVSVGAVSRDALVQALTTLRQILNAQ